MADTVRSTPSEIRMLAIDLDRTLLRSDKTLSEYTISTLNACREKGVLLVAATARPPRSVKALTKDVLWDAWVCAGGALVRAGEKTILREGVTARDARRILETLSKTQPEAKLSCEMDDTLYANFPVQSDWIGTIQVDGFSDLPDMPCEKILIDEKTIKGEGRLDEMLTDDMYIVRDIDGLAMIMNRHASKMHGLRALCAFFSISFRQIAAFGDDTSDIEMLRDCGIGVAVENAIPEAREAALCICGNNDGDGVAKWIAETLLR